MRQKLNKIDTIESIQWIDHTPDSDVSQHSLNDEFNEDEIPVEGIEEQNIETLLRTIAVSTPRNNTKISIIPQKLNESVPSSSSECISEYEVIEQEIDEDYVVI